MDQLSDEQTAHLRSAIHTHAFLHRLVRKIEHLLRVVFHAEDLDWRHIRSAAEEIMIADILTRHHGNIDGVYFALRKSEAAGHTWEQAIADYAAYAHNYFTTPLGVVLRRNFFGENSHFVTPSAGRYAPISKTAPNQENADP